MDALPVAGWYPDPEGSASPRWWDGQRWGDLAPAPAPSPAPVATMAPGTDPFAPPPSFAHGVLPRVRGRRKIQDVHVFGDRLAITPLSGADPETLGALAGFLLFFGVLGAVIGNAVGRIIAKSQTTTRLARTATMAPDQLAASERAEVLPLTSIASLEARHHGSGGRFRMQLTDGSTRKYSWAKAHTKDVDVDGLLHGMAPGRAVVHPLTTARKVARWAGVVLLVLIVVGIVAAVVVAATSEEGVVDTVPNRPAALTVPLGRACSAWGVLAAKEDPTVDEIRATIAQARPDLEAAAAADETFRQAADSIAFLDGYFAAPTAEQQPLVEGAATDVDDACARS